LSSTSNAPTIVSLGCDVRNLLCSVQLSQAAPSTGITLALQSDSRLVQVTGQIQVPAGSQSATFPITVLASDQDQQAFVTASLH
jgi:hypothetical protein